MRRCNYIESVSSKPTCEYKQYSRALNSKPRVLLSAVDRYLHEQSPRVQLSPWRDDWADPSSSHLPVPGDDLCCPIELSRGVVGVEIIRVVPNRNRKVRYLINYLGARSRPPPDRYARYDKYLVGWEQGFWPLLLKYVRTTSKGVKQPFSI